MRILLAGESWITYATHIKGFDNFVTCSYEEGGQWLIDSLQKGGHTVDYLPNHVAAAQFPTTAEALSQYDVVMLSDIGANTLLLHPATFSRSVPTANRLNLIADYVSNGGSLLMIGGYLTFQGIEAKGHWYGTVVEDVLPIKMLPGDDRVEEPQGVSIEVVRPDHPVMKGIPTEWPQFLGYNRLLPKEGANVLARRGQDVFIAVGQYGKGRSMAFASDCGPHWGPPPFVNWEHYATFWNQAVEWLGAKA